MTRVATTVHAFGDADGAAREAWLAEAASQAAASGAAADAQAAAAQRWLEECDRVQGAATLRVTSTHDAVCEAVAQVQLAVDAGIDRGALFCACVRACVCLRLLTGCPFRSDARCGLGR